MFVKRTYKSDKAEASSLSILELNYENLTKS